MFRKPNCKFAADFLGVSNIFRGESIVKKDIALININGLSLASAATREGGVYASVRPEDILVSVKPFESSARNTFKGNIQDISDTGVVVRITIDVGIPLVVAITRRSFIDMGLRQGMEVFVTFKAMDVHVF